MLHVVTFKNIAYLKSLFQGHLRISLSSCSDMSLALGVRDDDQTCVERGYSCAEISVIQEVFLAHSVRP